MDTIILKSLNETDKLKAAGELASLVQHQINNPLAVVLGNVQFILMKNLDLDQALLERLRIVEKAALKIADVNKKLSEISSAIDNKK